jgi:hypothetical protein
MFMYQYYKNYTYSAYTSEVGVTFKAIGGFGSEGL